MASCALLSDDELFGLLQENDASAYAEIYDRYKKPLYLHALKMLRDREEAKDVIQELFTVLWHKRGHLTLTDALSAYLYTSVRNRILDRIAHEKVQERYLDSLQDYLMEGVYMTDHQIREKELAAIIEKEIGNLPLKMRQVFEMSRKEHLSHREIAQRLNISETTVKKQVSNAVKILRLRLNLVLLLGVLLNW